MNFLWWYVLQMQQTTGSWITNKYTLLAIMICETFYFHRLEHTRYSPLKDVFTFANDGSIKMLLGCKLNDKRVWEI